MDKELLKQALDKWGYDAQANMLIEECSELIHAICKVKRFPASTDWGGMRQGTDKVCEEIADVKILIAQFEIDKEYEFAINDWVDLKIKRLKKRLENGS